MNRHALLLVAAGITAFIAAFYPLHEDGLSVRSVLHATERVHDRVTEANVRDVPVAEDLSTKDVQRDAGLLVRVVQLLTLVVFVPGIMLVGLAGVIRGEFAIFASIVVAILGAFMVRIAYPFGDLRSTGIAWVVAGSIAVVVGVHAFYLSVRRERVAHS